MDEETQYRGVMHDRKTGKWAASIYAPATDKEPAKHFTLGAFQTAKDAALQYDRAMYIRKRDKARQEGRPVDVMTMNLNLAEELTQEEMDKLEGVTLDDIRTGSAAASMSNLSGGQEDVSDVPQSSPQGKSPGKRIQKKRVVDDLGARPAKKKAGKTLKKDWKPKKILPLKGEIKKSRMLDTSQKWKGPQGWKVRVWQRHGEKGGYDMQIVAPSGAVMRSLKQLEEFLQSNGGGEINDFVLPYKSPKRLPKKKKVKVAGRVKKVAKAALAAKGKLGRPGPGRPSKQPPLSTSPAASLDREEEETNTEDGPPRYSCPPGFDLQLADRMVDGAVFTEWTILTPEGEVIRSLPDLADYLKRTNQTMQGFILPPAEPAQEPASSLTAKGKGPEGEGQQPQPPSPLKRKMNRRKRKDQGPWVRKAPKKPRHEESPAEGAEGAGQPQVEEPEVMDLGERDQSDSAAEQQAARDMGPSAFPATRASSQRTAEARNGILTQLPAPTTSAAAPVVPPAPHQPRSHTQRIARGTIVSHDAIIHPEEHHHPSRSGGTEGAVVRGPRSGGSGAVGVGEVSIGLGRLREGEGVSPNMAGPLTPAPGGLISSDAGVSGGATVGGGELAMTVVPHASSMAEAEAEEQKRQAVATAAAEERGLAMSEVERYNELDASLDEEILRKMQEVSRLAQQQTQVRLKVREEITKAEMEREKEVLVLRQGERVLRGEIEQLRAQVASGMQLVQQERARNAAREKMLGDELARERAVAQLKIAELESSLQTLHAELREVRDALHKASQVPLPMPKKEAAEEAGAQEVVTVKEDKSQLLEGENRLSAHEVGGPQQPGEGAAGPEDQTMQTERDRASVQSSELQAPALPLMEDAKAKVEAAMQPRYEGGTTKDAGVESIVLPSPCT